MVKKPNLKPGEFSLHRLTHKFATEAERTTRITKVFQEYINKKILVSKNKLQQHLEKVKSPLV